MNDFERTRSLRDNILAAIGRTGIDEALKELLASKRLMRSQAATHRLAQDDFVVGVIGRQGVGKSSLTNALLGRRILPVDEDETTNVICKTRTCGPTEERAEVVYLDGRTETGPLEQEFLGKFTDEQRNPHNERRVAEVICHVHSPVLQSGITLADTPGVGSLLGHTAQATQDFIPNISLGVFLMSTTPTLLHGESLFLRATWAQSQSFIFVQNKWGETAEQLADARADNLRKLLEIAEEEDARQDIEIAVVDVHQALDGRANDWDADVDASGLLGLVESLNKRLGGGAARAHLFTNAGAILDALDSAIRSAGSRLEALAVSAEADSEAFNNAIASRMEQLEDVREQWQTKRTGFRADLDQLIAGFRDNLEVSVEEAENRVVSHVEARDMGADTIAAVLQDELQLAVKGPANDLSAGYALRANTYVSDADELRAAVLVSLAHIDYGQGIDSTAGDLLWTERAEGAGNLAVGAGGLALATLGGAALWAGGAAIFGGASVSAAAAAAAAAIPGLGLAIAGAVLVVGFAFKTAAERKAVAALIKAVHSAARAARKAASRDVVKSVKDAARKLDQALDEELQAAIQQQCETASKIRSDRTRTSEEREAIKRMLTEQLGLLQETSMKVDSTLRLASGG